MLLVTLLTCGFGGIVMGIIGLIEGILYFTKSDDVFYQEYGVEKKAGSSSSYRIKRKIPEAPKEQNSVGPLWPRLVRYFGGHRFPRRSSWLPSWHWAMGLGPPQEH